MFDLIIRNAKIIDGSCAPWYIADVAVKDGKISQIGRIDSEARELVDAERKILTPGFIDIHSHSDAGILLHKENESRILQGVTTELGGDCGSSPMPLTPERRENLRKSYSGFAEKELEPDWEDTAGFLDKIEANGTSVNYATLAGHGSIRIAAMGFDDREPVAGELEQMRKLTAQCMEQGCFGISSGLIYPPGSYAKNDEIMELAKVAASYGGFYKTHMRWEGDEVLQSVEETITVAEKTGIPTQIDHHKVLGKKNWKYKSRATIARIIRARDEGLDITADQYPYTATATSLTTNIPDWAHEGGIPKLLERLKDSQTRKKLSKEIEENTLQTQRSWASLFVSSVKSEKNAWVMGKNIEDIAKESGKEPIDAIIDLLIEEGCLVDQVNFAMDEEDVEHIMQQSFVMIGSDGSVRSLKTKEIPHPRSFGTFPRVISKYCRERKLFSLETAIHKMTGMSAARMGLHDRGIIKTGMWADLVLFDYEKINDTPTFTKPAAACEGILRVYVNGVLTALNGKHTGANAGKVLRHGRYI